jgi:hypothetical protein
MLRRRTSRLMLRSTAKNETNWQVARAQGMADVPLC